MPPYSDFNAENHAPITNDNNSNGYRIRSMIETDIPVVYAIDKATWKNQAWPLEFFFDYLKSPGSNCWILENNTTNCKILGYGFQYFSNGIAHIANLCIHPNHRGRGLGGILLRHMINYSQQFGVSIIELEVNTLNINAYTLYFKHGFRKIQYLERYYSEIEDAYLMQLRVNRIV